MSFSEYFNRFAAGCKTVFKGVLSFVKTTAPVAEAVGAATGNPKVVAAAKVAFTAANVADAAVKAEEQREAPK